MSNNQSHTITIRHANGADADALAHLAELDSGQVPAQPLLIAHVGGELMAAVSEIDGHAISNPFHPTVELVWMLRTEAGVTEKAPSNGLRAYRRLWQRSPRPAGPRPSAPSIPGIPVIPGRTL